MLTQILSTYVPFLCHFTKDQYQWGITALEYHWCRSYINVPPALLMLTLLSPWLSLSRHRAFRARISTSRQQVDRLHDENPVSHSTASY